MNVLKDLSVAFVYKHKPDSIEHWLEQSGPN